MITEWADRPSINGIPPPIWLTLSIGRKTRVSRHHETERHVDRKSQSSYKDTGRGGGRGGIPLLLLLLLPLPLFRRLWWPGTSNLYLPILLPLTTLLHNAASSTEETVAKPQTERPAG
jgi:hypothetical protein